MSLMRLLTNGKTLVDLKQSTGRYHMPGKNYFPKFGPVKNPFAPAAPKTAAPVTSPAAPEPAPADKPAAAPAAAPADTTAPAPRTAQAAAPAVSKPSAQLKETQRLPGLSSDLKETKRLPFVAARKGVPPPPTALERFLDGAGAWMAKLPQWWARRKAPARSAIPRFDRPVVQGELSLENIKVVRNDLHDADVEVSPARTLSSDANFKPALTLQTNSASDLQRRPSACVDR